MQTESFGTGLRAQRERQGVTLAGIAEQTKIKLSLLEGLERDDVSRWPEGIFRKAYVRAYAKAVGLDPDVIVRRFLEVYPEPVEPSPDDARSSGRLRYLFDRLRRSAGPEPRAAGETPALPAMPESGVQRQLTELAALCTTLGGAADRREVATALHQAVNTLGAVGLIVWLWDPRRKVLISVLAHGYSAEILAQLPAVPFDADNAIASVFRLVDAQVVGGNDSATGAVVAPIITPNGCAGVVAIELADGKERSAAVRAFTVILAAQLATVISVPAEGSLYSRREAH